MAENRGETERMNGLMKNHVVFKLKIETEMFSDYSPLEKAQFSEGIPGIHIDWNLQGQLEEMDKLVFSVWLKKPALQLNMTPIL